MTTKADHVVDQAADRLQEIADKAAAQEGVAAKLAQPLADDAAFLRKLKPSLIKARARGNAPAKQPPAHGIVEPTAPRLEQQPKPRGKRRVNPFLVVGVAFGVGIVLAKVIDWRGYAYPRD
jgi:hypothetical protein